MKAHTKTLLTALTAVAAMTLPTTSADAATIAVYGMGQLGPTSELSASVSGGDMTAGGGLGNFNANTGWTTYGSEPVLITNPTSAAATSNVDTAFNNDAFFSITITPEENVTLDFTQVSFDVARGGTSGPRNIAIRTSLTGTTNVLPEFTVSASRSTFENKAVDLSGVTALQDVTEATTFHFIVATGADNRSLEWDNITFDADVTVVPEPATALLSGLGLLLLLRRRRCPQA